MGEISSLIPFNIGLLLGSRNFIREILRHNSIPLPPVYYLNPSESMKRFCMPKRSGFRWFWARKIQNESKMLYRIYIRQRKPCLLFSVYSGYRKHTCWEASIRNRIPCVYAYTGFMNICSRFRPDGEWIEYKPDDDLLWRSTGESIIKAFPGLRIAIFDGVKEHDSGLVYVEKYFYQYRVNAQFVMRNAKNATTVPDALPICFFRSLDWSDRLRWVFEAKRSIILVWQHKTS